MDTQKLRMLTLAAAGAVAATVATNALACDTCLTDPNYGNSGMCWSGMDEGVTACWGGMDEGQWCQTSGYCQNNPPQPCPGEYGYCEQYAWDDYFCWGWGMCS